MSATGAFGRFCGRQVPGLTMAVAVIVGTVQPGYTEQEPQPSITTTDVLSLDGTTAPSLDELRLHAMKIGELLDHASARVDRLADEAGDKTVTVPLVSAIRQELDLSRQWNRHLSSILLEVAEARRTLGIRERKVAAEIFELTTIAEEARLELVTLWESLKPDAANLVEIEAEQPAIKPGADQDVGLSVYEADAVVKELAGPRATIMDAKRTLDEMSAAQKAAAGDIEAVRAKIIDALQTLAPHREEPLKAKIPADHKDESSISSREITAWAASIVTKLHHEGFGDFEEAAKSAGINRSVLATQPNVPEVEVMVIRGQTLSTAAVRNAPDRLAVPITTIAAGSPILVTGKVIDHNWYRVAIDNGRHGFISGDLIKRQATPAKPTRRIKPS